MEIKSLWKKILYDFFVGLLSYYLDLNKLFHLDTVIIMNLLRLRYRPVTVPLPLQRYRDRPSATVTYRYWPLPTVSNLYQALHALPNVTSVTERYRALQSVTERYSALQNVTERYRTLQSVTERYIFYLIKNF